jgi:16S rRNA (uracil1498-N3)-methyltransferase
MTILKGVVFLLLRGKIGGLAVRHNLAVMSRSQPPRLYLPIEVPAHGVCELPPEQSHHAVHVLRLAAGDAVIAFDGRGNQYAATIERVSKSRVTLTLGEPQAVDRESPLDVTLAQGISSGERMDYTIQKAVELGVGAIQPLATERSVVRLGAERAAKRLAHWQGVVIAACEQSGRNRVPPVLPVAPLANWLGGLSPGALRLTLTPAASRRLAELERPAAPMMLLVGPEGGLSPREHADAIASGFTSIRLGPRVLRTETAAVAALAAMQTLWGDF